MAIDIGSGKVYLDAEDIAIPGRFPLSWGRRYHSALAAHSDGPHFGPGWTGPYFAALTRIGKEYRFRTPQGAIVPLPDPEDSVERAGLVRDLGTCHEIKRQGQYLRVSHWNFGGAVANYLFLPARHGEWWPLRSLEDPAGEGVDLAWDEQGRLKGVRQKREKRTLVAAYGPGGRIGSVALRHPDGRQSVLVRYEYDGNGRLSAAFDAAGTAERYEYDAQGRLQRELARDGGVFTYKYDDRDRCIRYSGLDNYDLKVLRYLDHVWWTEVTDSYGGTRRYEKLPTGQILREIDPAGAITETEYDGYGRIVARIRPMGERETYEYDDRGNRCALVDALGGVSAFEFDDEHLLTCEIDANGGRWRRIYDDRHRPIAALDPLGNRYEIEYDRAGNPVAVRNPAGAVSRRAFTENGVLREATDWTGARTAFERDDFGRTVLRTDPDGRRIAFAYDALGRLLKAEEDNGRSVSYAYDAVGNVVGLARTGYPATAFRFGTCRRLLEKREAGGAPVRFRWGTEPGRLLAVRNERGSEYVFSYDACGRVASETDFDGRRLDFAYDTTGNCIRKTNGAGQHVEMRYDALGRLVRERLDDGEETSFGYDATWNLVAAEGPAGKLAFVRDPIGRIIAEEQSGIGIRRAFGHGDGPLKLESDAGADFAYAYDEAGRPLSIAANGLGSFGFSYDAKGRPETVELPGGMRLGQAWDARGRLLNQAVAGADPGSARVIERGFAYDDSDLLVALTDRFWGRSLYRHTPQGRLAGFEYADRHIGYHPDEAGDGVASEGTRDAEAGKFGLSGALLEDGEHVYAYDAAGRMISKRGKSEPDPGKSLRFAWDAKDRLRQLTTPSGEVWRYDYDAVGRRVRKQGPGRSIRFVWDGYALLHEIEEGAGTITWGFERSGIKPLFRISAGSLHAIIRDHLGVPREMLDSSGRISWSAVFDPRGNPLQGKGRLEDCPFRFPGQYADAESGLYYNIHRYYDPAAGIYISRDPIRMRGGVSLYQYVRNPLKFIDPLGLCEGDENEETPKTLYHYTDEEGMKAILESQELRPSLKAVNPKDARYGDGQYLSDIPPGTKTPAQLSSAFIRNPFQGRRFTHFVEIDVTGLDVQKGRDNVFVVPNDQPLDISNRVVSSGKN